MEIKYNGGLTVDPNVAAILDDLRASNPTAQVVVFQPMFAGKPVLNKQGFTITAKELDLMNAIYEGRFGLKLRDLKSKRTGANASVTLIYDLAPEDQPSHD